MTTFLPKDLQADLDAARAQKKRARSRLSVRFGERSFPILRLWDSGFAIDADRAPHLRGYVDVYKGENQLLTCLIVASQLEEDEVVFDFKRMTAIQTGPALDFERDPHAPVALIENYKTV